MPDLQQVKRAAFTQIGNLTGATVEYKIARLELVQALVGEKGAIEQGRALTKAENARMGLDSAWQLLGGILQDHGFRGHELQQAGNAIMQEVNDEATRLVAQRLGPEKMESLGLDPEGKPLVGEEAQGIIPPSTISTPNISKDKGSDTPRKFR